ncbi:Glucose/arabinose dehydrogenase, beta-propeller fold [Amycolatopsis xylanica]|uniref:Glucose/arabinose dehydrogenase, beta-propeller fold n=2 Tax=Amycolatopsis xylanica TaxID=589385 RepID=A0A1H2Z1J5_9PSEU|nr:Glucose/arabinose dehydrogenase, beta-propeller fold [Amycolatopsis xylanica]
MKRTWAMVCAIPLALGVLTPAEAFAADTTPPSTPTGVQVTKVSANSVALSWTASTDDVAVQRYNVYTGTTLVGWFTGTSGSIDGLAPKTAQTFTVRAMDAAKNLSPDSAPVTATTRRGHDSVGQVTTIAPETDVPWGLAFLPDGSALYGDRDAQTVNRLSRDGKAKTLAGKVPGVVGTNGEGGLLGLELSPHFRWDHWVYLYHTSETDNRIVRIKYEHGALDLASEQVLLSGIVKNKFHNGGRLRFGPDDKLYASVGDGQTSANAQDVNSLNGKILRLNPDGSPAADNPFYANGGNARYVWSMGHRNLEGLAFDSHGRLWESEFGNSILDELNLIEKGGNYGWPACEGTVGDCANPAFKAPVRTWKVADASPSGIAIVHDTIYMSALRGEALWVMKIDGDTTSTPVAYFHGKFGRVRTVEPSPDCGLWITTSNGGDKNNIPDDTNAQFLHVSLGH